MPDWTTQPVQEDKSHWEHLNTLCAVLLQPTRAGTGTEDAWAEQPVDRTVVISVIIES